MTDTFAAGNLLGRETSPYLLQHKDNPVHWRPWGPDALAEAKRDGKPILLSVGYAACHWCHVMAHESFEDPETAAVMNEKFVNIKVDREERPDIDLIYQNALQLMGEHGGWPLTMFLTADGAPFWGGTYFPKGDRYGRPAFTRILRQISDAHAQQPDHVAENARSLTDGLARMNAATGGGRLSPDALNQAAAAAARMIDTIHGGTAGAPKFPQVPFFKMLWRAAQRTNLAAYADAVTVTLDRMCQGGIYDHLGGGFARYSTDEIWLAPHFEKMLYDNALLVDLLTEVWTKTRADLYAVRVRETVEWLCRDMAVAADGETAFASAFDADSEGEEGRYYVWREAEIDALLQQDAPLFKQHYDVTAAGNWHEGGPGACILNRTARPEFATPSVETTLAAARARLLAERAGRVPPEWDDKVLADWNGLAIAALARAGAVFDEPDWIARARSAFRFVLAQMSDGDTLRHAWRHGTSRDHAVLDDYAAMARAALTLFEVTGEPDDLARAEAWADVVETRFRDPAGGYFLTATDADALITRPKSVFDNAVPSGNSVMAEVLARLAAVTGKDTYADAADALIKAATAADPRLLINSPGILTAYDLLRDGVQIVVAGPAGAVRRALERTAWQAPVVNKIVCVLEDGADLPPGHPGHGKGAVDGEPAAYVCRGRTCGLPERDPERLRRDLSAIR